MSVQDNFINAYFARSLNDLQPYYIVIMNFVCTYSNQIRMTVTV